MSIAFQCVCGNEVAVATDTEEVVCSGCAELWWRAPGGDSFQTIKPAGNRPIRGRRPSAVTFDEADADEFHDHGLQTGLAQADADGLCSCCGGTGLELGGWMGPTKEAPYPRACPRCDAGARLDTGRKVQLKVQELVDRSHEEGGGYWTRKYPAFTTLAGHLEDVERAVETDGRLPDVLDLPRVGVAFDPEELLFGDDLVVYQTQGGYDVLVSRKGKRPPARMVAAADVWKVVDTNGVQVIKHRDRPALYMECGERASGHRCCWPVAHPGPHKDDQTGMEWQ